MMGYKKIITFMLLLVIMLVVYFRDHYYLIFIAGIMFLGYKIDLHNKIYKLVNKVTGNNKKVNIDKSRKKMYLKKLIKNGGGEI